MPAELVQVQQSRQAPRLEHSQVLSIEHEILTKSVNHDQDLSHVPRPGRRSWRSLPPHAAAMTTTSGAASTAAARGTDDSGGHCGAGDDRGPDHRSGRDHRSSGHHGRGRCRGRHHRVRRGVADRVVHGGRRGLHGGQPGRQRRRSASTPPRRSCSRSPRARRPTCSPRPTPPTWTSSPRPALNGTEPVIFATNLLTIIVAPGQPARHHRRRRPRQPRHQDRDLRAPRCPAATTPTRSSRRPASR